MSILSLLLRRVSHIDFNGHTDWHSHILPGVDDGVKNMDEALEILNCYEASGIKDVWLTPHVMEDFPNTTEDLLCRFDELKSAYQGSVGLHLAAEHMIDGLFIDRLQAGDVLPIGHEGDHLLIETSYFSAPLNLPGVIEKIKSSGYHPLLAHPERYAYIRDFTEYENLKRQGVRFQLNLLSLAGSYGETAKEKAVRLMNKGMIDRIGSDLHRANQFDALKDMRLGKNLILQIERIKEIEL